MGYANRGQLAHLDRPPRRCAECGRVRATFRVSRTARSRWKALCPKCAADHLTIPFEAVTVLATQAVTRLPQPAEAAK